VRVFVAGATGAVGTPLVAQLVAGGHDVIGMTRSAQKADSLRALGAHKVAIADGLDRAAVIEAVTLSHPEVVIHQMTSLSRLGSLKNFDAEFATTNRLRTVATDNLLAAAHAAGARRFIAQSYGNWNYAHAGAGLKAEEDALDPTPPAKQRQSLNAIRYLESAVAAAAGMDGLALRYANFYGPRTGLVEGGDLAALVRRRRLPIVGDGGGVWTFIHVDDAAAATVAALDHGTPGIYNIVDDEPAATSVWLPELARTLGAKPPRHVPVWLARLIIGDVGVSMMTRIQGTSNAKAKRELGWTPRYATWRDGFRAVFSQAGPSTHRHPAH
jgi:nucleoside-diphosphate-sugar epimerase